VHSWWLELDETGAPLREIGFDEHGRPVVLGPVGRNEGMMTDACDDWSDSNEDSAAAAEGFDGTWSSLWPTFRHLAFPLSDLQKGIRSSDADVRGAFIQEIGWRGSDGVAALEDLVGVLEQDPSMSVRVEAARALGRMGPAAAEAIPALEQACRSGKPRLAAAASRALAFLRRE
jgi:HEAT repeat protein